MDKENHMVGKIILALTMLALWVANGTTPCLAASLTLTGSGTWAIGSVAVSTTSTSPNSPNDWTVKNDATSGYENISIKWSVTAWSGSPAASAWTSGASSASNQFVLTAYRSGGSQLVTSSNGTLFSLVAPNSADARAFGLSFLSPSAGEGGDHTLSITLTAAVSCGGYFNTYCWYYQGGYNNTSCTTTCGTHGGDISSVQLPTALQLAVLNNFTTASQYNCYIELCGGCGNPPGCTMTPMVLDYNTTALAVYDPYGTAWYSAALSQNTIRRMCPCAY